MRKQVALQLAAIPAVVLATMGQASAAAIDVSDVVTDIGAQVTPVGLIGGAVLLLTVAIAAFMWIRKAIK